MTNPWIIAASILAAPITLHLTEKPRLLTPRQFALIGLVAGLYLVASGSQLLQGWTDPVGALIAGDSESIGRIAKAGRGRGGIILLLWKYWPHVLIGWGGLFAVANGAAFLKAVPVSSSAASVHPKSGLSRIIQGIQMLRAHWSRVVAGLTLLVFLATVWPTPFRYHDWNQTIVRVNRFTGVAEVLEWNGWRTMRPTRYSPDNPFAPENQ